MDATTFLRVAEVAALPHAIHCEVAYDSSGAHAVILRVRQQTSARVLGTLNFDKWEWNSFLQACAAIDRNVEQLRDKGLVFDFSENPMHPPLPPPQKPGQGRVIFLAEKMLPDGRLERRECERLTDVEAFFKPDGLPLPSPPDTNPQSQSRSSPATG